MKEIYRIVPIYREWNNTTAHILTVDNITLTTCRPDRLQKYINSGGTLDDSDKIEAWMKYNNF